MSTPCNHLMFKSLHLANVFKKGSSCMASTAHPPSDKEEPKGQRPSSRVLCNGVRLCKVEARRKGGWSTDNCPSISCTAASNLRILFFFRLFIANLHMQVISPVAPRAHNRRWQRYIPLLDGRNAPMESVHRLCYLAAIRARIQVLEDLTPLCFYKPASLCAGGV